MTHDLNRKWTPGSTRSVLARAGGVALALAIISCGAPSVTPDRSDQPLARDDAEHAVVAGAIAARAPEPPSCALSAPGVAPVAHGVVERYPAAMAATDALDQSAAIQVARTAATKFGGAIAPADASTLAEQMSYAAFLAVAGWPANAAINAQRCVWIVTVYAPMPIKVAPGRPARVTMVYSVAVDAGSGTLIAILAGTALLR